MTDAAITKTAHAALQRLARAGASMRPDPRGGFCVACGGDARRRPLARVSAAEQRMMLSEGLLEAEPNKTHFWRLSAAGRAFLQRTQRVPASSPGAPILPENFIPQSPALRRLRALAAADAWFSAAELRAAERFERDCRLALLGPRVSADWGAAPMDRGRRGASGASHGPDCAVEARDRLARIGSAFGAPCIALLTDVLRDELGLEEIERRRAWPARSAKVALKLALSMLADFDARGRSDVRAA